MITTKNTFLGGWGGGGCSKVSALSLTKNLLAIESAHEGSKNKPKTLAL